MENDFIWTLNLNLQKEGFYKITDFSGIYYSSRLTIFNTVYMNAPESNLNCKVIVLWILINKHFTCTSGKRVRNGFVHVNLLVFE